ncbi:hypothetical protein ADIS_0257 [Lunatimonas lonarensis]|uniref:Uncharacterized protein n=1 Tax=Lunatimonas lonarensis TaxID=1232681 RepID=R7ZYS9_9BACT|nr:hypothetical protein ADIS_0257 [Lunatimonas lonarensis]
MVWLVFLSHYLPNLLMHFMGNLSVGQGWIRVNIPLQP